MRLLRRLVAAGLLVGSLGCGSSDTTTSTTPTKVAVTTTKATSTTARRAPEPTTIPLPPVNGPDPSPRVLVFYYPWYATEEFGGHWQHWGDMGNDPAVDIPSDYYPLLGAYSSYDPAVAAQHMAWLREAGVGGVVTSWWGKGTYEDSAVPVILDAAERYGLQVAFHVEPYEGRSSSRLVADVEYILDTYGAHPALYRTTETSRWNDDPSPKALFFIWNSGHADNTSGAVEASYWQSAVDAIHDLGAGVIADIPDGTWIDGGHFDGLYNYATLETAPEFAWARTIPPDGWFVPSVIPGFSAVRIGYDPSTFVPRDAGTTYEIQWAAALGTGIKPTFVTITSFNEWHEGTQIEPAQEGRQRGPSQSYMDYRPLGPMGYLHLTAPHVQEFLAETFEKVRSMPIRVEITTTSDWTTVTVLSGGNVARPEITSVDDPGRVAWEGKRLAVLQPIDDAQRGDSVTAVVDLEILDPGNEIAFLIERGSLGSTIVKLSPRQGGVPGISVNWSGTNEKLVDGESGRNPFTFTVTSADLGG